MPRNLIEEITFEYISEHKLSPIDFIKSRAEHPWLLSNLKALLRQIRSRKGNKSLNRSEEFRARKYLDDLHKLERDLKNIVVRSRKYDPFRTQSLSHIENVFKKIVDLDGYRQTADKAITFSHHFNRSPVHLFLSLYGTPYKTKETLIVMFKHHLHESLKEKDICRLEDMLAVAWRDFFKKKRNRTTRQIKKRKV